MSLNKPFGHVRGHLHTVQDALDAQRRLVEYLRGVADSLLAYCLTRLIEQESEGDGEDDGGKQHHPQAYPDG